MRIHIIVAGTLVLAFLTGCKPSPQSSRGFRLPDGDIERGREAFVALHCYSCHRVDGVELPAPTSFNLTLGGETQRVRTYGELVTSIIHPSHVISENYKQELTDANLSPMPEFNHVMTVKQMIDLVAFLQSRYELVEADFDHATGPY